MKLVLLDRDGVINEDRPEGVLRHEEFRLLPGALDAIARLTRAGYKIAICTNQSAIGMGRLAPATLDAIHADLCQQVTDTGGRIDAIYFAPDAPDAPSDRRKPAPGMLLEALAKFEAEAAHTFMVGDMLRDLEAAERAGCQRILVRTGKGAALEARGLPPHVQPVKVVADLPAAAEYILTQSVGIVR
jgi:D-glycero-D-manno-heptose 1,7-bisphosphate phosphatase